ncbi:hypothetical protein [Caminibacter sp.]
MNSKVEKLFKKIENLKNKIKKLEKELEEEKMKVMGKKVKIILPYSCKAEVVGDYVAYFESEEEAKEVLDAIKNGKMFVGEIDWNIASEEIYDTWEEDYDFEDAEIKTIKTNS